MTILEDSLSLVVYVVSSMRQRDRAREGRGGGGGGGTYFIMQLYSSVGRWCTSPFDGERRSAKDTEVTKIYSSACR